MEIPDPTRIVKIGIVSMLSTLPLVVWVFLGGSGGLGAFSETEACNSITIAAIMATAVVNALILPIFYWPRVLNGEDDGKRVLRKGTAARGIIRSMGEPIAVPVHTKQGSFTGLRVSVEVEHDGRSYFVSRHLTHVPEALLHSLSEGMEIPVRVSRQDRMNIAIDWKPLLGQYLGGGDS